MSRPAGAAAMAELGQLRKWHPQAGATDGYIFIGDGLGAWVGAAEAHCEAETSEADARLRAVLVTDRTSQDLRDRMLAAMKAWSRNPITAGARPCTCGSS